MCKKERGESGKERSKRKEPTHGKKEEVREKEARTRLVFEREHEKGKESAQTREEQEEKSSEESE